MSESQTPVTKAEKRARAYAKQLEEAGYTPEITVTVHAPTLYSDGEVMLPGLVSARVHATGPNLFGDTFGFGFMSWLPAKGHRASTKWSFGNLHRTGRPTKKIKNERELASRIATEVWFAQQRASQTAEAEAAEVQS